VSESEEAVAAELVDGEIVFTSPYTPEPVHGRQGFMQMIGALRASFPDLARKRSSSAARTRC
jgi:hypothetical protein